MKVTLGGDRLGSGNKNKIALHNYERSTHNLDQKVTTSMQCGVLYPFSVIPAMRGDSFSIDVNADARTIPTRGPLFGSFKMQIDYFLCPFRLYQGILHNNPLKIGLNMSQVKLPILNLHGHKHTERNKVNNTSLLKYLGISGLGHVHGEHEIYSRAFNAIPLLAYYDIFKNYYANKQEQNAYVIGERTSTATERNFTIVNVTYQVKENGVYVPSINSNVANIEVGKIYIPNIEVNKELHNMGEFYVTCIDSEADESVDIPWSDLKDIAAALEFNLNWKQHKKFDNSNDYIVSFELDFESDSGNLHQAIEEYCNTKNHLFLRFDRIEIEENNTIAQRAWDIPLQLNAFNLQNLDDMRLELLSFHTLGSAFKISLNGDWNNTSGTDGSGLPYSINFTQNTEGINHYQSPLNGLMVKTYQSDLFNNWVQTEWIDGENGIAAITAIDTSSGSFMIDTLNLSEKLYNMLNRVAASDGTYEGWQDAVYTDTPKRHIESPVYLGGASNEIVFEEIVQTTPTANAALGTLGGKGKLIKRKGGHINVKVDEASFIIGIVSLTPRINYTQGNEWYMTDLFSMDDLHKPALDGIGFQNLIGEQLAWWDTAFGEGVATRSIIGKVPAWINYMTRVDKGFGDFAETDGNGFMLLQRNYEPTDNGHHIKDATTYIDPAKYNYAFAYDKLDAQNFWVQIYEHVVARRLMSAKQIPNI